MFNGYECDYGFINILTLSCHVVRKGHTYLKKCKGLFHLLLAPSIEELKTIDKLSKRSYLTNRCSVIRVHVLLESFVM